jgi:hypothetical protein
MGRRGSAERVRYSGGSAALSSRRVAGRRHRSDARLSASGGRTRVDGFARQQHRQTRRPALRCADRRWRDQRRRVRRGAGRARRARGAGRARRFAGGVSSNSSNLAWGGIKYLESREFLLVNKLCRSRNELMRAYPSTVKEIRFFTTIQRGFRVWSFFVFLGSVLYWLIGRCKTQAPRYLSPRPSSVWNRRSTPATPPAVSSTRTATSTTTTRASSSALSAGRWIWAATRPTT